MEGAAAVHNPPMPCAAKKGRVEPDETNAGCFNLCYQAALVPQENLRMEHHASCYCGHVTLVAKGDPASQCFCHCSSCRRWSGQPVTACILWPDDRVRFLKGTEKLHRFSVTGHPEGGKFSCQVCGGAVCTFVPSARLYDIFAGVLADFDFRPTIHINYGERVISMHDGLPKFRDMPEHAGGSGTLVGE
jgi:hypothetical protein